MTLSEIIESLEMIDDSPTKQRCKVQFLPIFAPDKITQSIIIEFLPIETSLEIDVPSIDELVVKLISEYQFFPSTIPTE